MKKLLSTFLTLFSFIFILILPVFLGLHASMMSHHGMSAGECIEHCLLSETHLHTTKAISFGGSIVPLLIRVFSSKTFEYILPLTLLYIILLFAPPNLSRNIKNYDYSCLIGILKLTT